MCISKWKTSKDRAQQIVGLLRVARRDVDRIDSYQNTDEQNRAVVEAHKKISDAIDAVRSLKEMFNDVLVPLTADSD